jgi:hypothetical protein
MWKTSGITFGLLCKSGGARRDRMQKLAPYTTSSGGVDANFSRSGYCFGKPASLDLKTVEAANVLILGEPNAVDNTRL